MKPCDQNLVETLKIAEQMILLATKGYEEREDDSCGILYGVLLDAAFKIQELAEKEKLAHIKKGWWR